jgi:regulator of protease activity HflC (stomatin/prohibitin superfamily)
MQAAAERERKATVIQAEGQKQAAILQADARLEAAKRDADAQVTLANASATAIKNVMAASAGADTPMLYLLGEKYIKAITQMGTSPNAKVIVLPADIQDTVRGVMGKFGK